MTPLKAAGWNVFKENDMNQRKKPSLLQALKKGAEGFAAMTPMLLGVIGLVGLLQSFITPDMLAAAFGWSTLTDTLIGTFAGAVASGNAAVSYLIGGELLEEGTSLYAVTAFILAWVTLGFVQLPAEAAALGVRFTFYRNLFALIATIGVAVATVATVGCFR